MRYCADVVIHPRLCLILPALLLWQCFLYAPSQAQSDSTDRLRFGVLAGGGITLHTAEFKELVGLPSCCPLYRNGTGISPTGGVFVELPLSSDITQGFRLFLTDVSGRLTSVESEPVIMNSRIQIAQIEHSVDAHIRGIGIEPITNFRIIKQFSTFVGLRADVAMRGSVEQREELLVPEVGTFENGKRIRNEASGGIYGMQPFILSLLAGFRFTLPLNKNNSVFLMPELSFSLGMNSLLYSQDWRSHTMRLGLGLAFQSPRLPVVSEEIEPVPPPNIAAELHSAVFNGTEEKPEQALRLDEFETEHIHPLLPMVFFEQNSDVLPARYRFLTHDEVADYTPEKSDGVTALSAYYHLLNIVGYRLRQYPAETISLVGCNADSDAEKANTQLSRRRAENVSQYLQQVWGIDRKRITIEARNKPEYPSTAPAREATAENRRVEIRASSRILAPLTLHSSRFVASPPYLRLRPASGGSDIVDRWELYLYQGRERIKSMSGNGGLPLKLQVDLRDEAIPLHSTDSLTASMIVNGRSGIATSAQTTIRTDGWTLSRKIVEHSEDTVFVHSTILFTRDIPTDEELPPSLINAIKTRLQPGSTLSLMDHRSSTADYARKVQSWIGADANAALLFNRDDTVVPYSYTFPEGRMYNNSVEVRIRSVIHR